MRSLSSRSWRFALVCLSLWGCGGGADQPGPVLTGSPEHRFVAFRRHSMWIDRLDVPIAPPLAAGSSPSRELVRSESPDVVEVDANGWLIGRSNGRTTVWSTSGSKLDVTVASAHRLAFDPPIVRASPGDVVPLRLVANGAPVPFETARWSMSDPRVAAIDATGLHANGAGQATIRAEYGSGSVDVAVSVAGPDAPVVLLARRTKLLPGQTEEIRTPSGGSGSWTTSDPKVLQSLGEGVYFARQPGKVRACVQEAGRFGCIEIEVSRAATAANTRSMRRQP